MHRTSRNMILAVCILARIAPISSQEQVNRHSLTIQDFEKRTDEYMKLHKAASAQLTRLKPTNAPQKISDHEKALASRIREARTDAQQGNIFTPEIQIEFLRLIDLAMPTPKDEARIK